MNVSLATIKNLMLEACPFKNPRIMVIFNDNDIVFHWEWNVGRSTQCFRRALTYSELKRSELSEMTYLNLFIKQCRPRMEEQRLCVKK